MAPEVRPPKSFEIKLIKPSGVEEMKYFIVFTFLYADHVRACSLNFNFKAINDSIDI